MLRGLPASGKGQPVNSILPTPEGDKKIGELKVGDYVFGSNGKPTKVIGVFPRGVLPLYKVVFKDGATLTVDGDHIWTFEGRLKRSDDGGRVRYNYTTKDLFANPNLVSPRVHGGSLKQLPLVAPLEYTDDTLAIDPYVLGLYLADGSCGQNGVPRITKKEQGVVEYMMALPDAPHNKHAYGDNTPYYTYSRGSNPLYAYLKRVGLADKKSAEKFIPEEIFTKSISIRKRFLYGLMDGDGSLGKKKASRGAVARYSTTSEALKNGVVRLVTSLGGATKISVRDAKRRAYWQISIYTEFNPFLATHESGEWSPRHRHLNTWRALDHIEKAGYGEVVCIAVEAENQLYVGDAQFHIVTHNTTWAKEQVAKGGYLRVSMDDIRASVFGGWSIKKEKACLRLRDDMVKFGIKEGKNVIIDATNLNPKHEIRLKRLAEELGVPFVINDQFLKVSPEECIERDLHRGKEAVGAKVIWDMWEKWIRPNSTRKLEKDPFKRRAIIINLDGTLSQKVTDRSDYDPSRANEDIPNPLISYLMDCLAGCGEYYADALIISDREEKYRELTEKWLRDNCIEYKTLYMRPDGNRNSSVKIKEEIYHNEIEPYYSVVGVLEDNISCAMMYYSLGIEVLKAGNPLK